MMFIIHYECTLWGGQFNENELNTEYPPVKNRGVIYECEWKRIYERAKRTAKYSWHRKNRQASC